MRDDIILVDGVIFQLQAKRPAGISRVWRSLIEELARSPLGPRIRLLDRNSTAPDIPGIRRIPGLRFEPKCPEADPFYLEHVMRQERARLFLSTYHTLPENSPGVVMVHDMTPEVMGFDLGHPEWRAKSAAIERACAYFTVSESTRNDFQRWYPEHARKPAFVVPNAVGPAFHLHSDEAVQQFKRRQGLKRPYFMLSGQRRGYKNAMLFFRALSQMVNKGELEVLCTGGDPVLEKVFVRLLDGLRVSVRFFSDNDLSLAYAGAAALVYPSLYEGFGLPLLEAMRSGCPVIACRNSSIPEVAGDAALLIGGHDVEEMRQALNQVRQPQTRAELVAKGLSRSELFSWEVSGRRFAASLEELLARRSEFADNPTAPLTTGPRLLYGLVGRSDPHELKKALGETIKILSQDEVSLKPEGLDRAESVICSYLDRSGFMPMLEEACRCRDCDGFLHYWLGLVEEGRGREGAAFEQYTLALKCGLSVPPLLLRAARLAAAQGRLVSGRKMIEQLLKMRSSDAGVVKLDQGLKHAQDELRETMELRRAELRGSAPGGVAVSTDPERVDVSVVLPAKGRSSGVEDFLASLPLAMSGLRYEVLFYAGDEDESALKELREQYQIDRMVRDRDLFEPGEPFSWSRVMNHAFRQARGTWVMYASDDIVVRPGAFVYAVGLASERAKVGGITFLHRNTVEDFGGRFRDYGYDKVGGHTYINFGLVRREAFEHTSGFDERFKFYWADADLCMQLWDAGYEIVASPWSLVEHNNVVDQAREDNSGDRYALDTKGFLDKWRGRSLIKAGKVLCKERHSLASTDADRVLAETARICLPACERAASIGASPVSEVPPGDTARVRETGDERVSPVTTGGRNDVPLVSVLVSTYNAERFMHGCLADLDSQTIADRLQVIVVDSASPQNEQAIVRGFRGRFSSLDYIRTEGRETVYAAWNRALHLARGTYVTNANTDDRHRTDAFEILVRTLEENPEVVLVYADCLVTREENETFETTRSQRTFRWLDFSPRDLVEKGCFVGPQPMWRRDLHLRHGQFDESFAVAGDYEFWLRLAREHDFLHIRETLGLYLESSGSVEHTDQERAIRESRRAQTLHRKAIFERLSARDRQADPLRSTPESLGGLTRGKAGEAEVRWKGVAEAIEERPFHPEAWLSLAEIAKLQGATKVARHCAEHARDLAPGLKRAARHLRDLPKSNGQAPGWMRIPADGGTRLTVCLITRNEEKYVGQCLQSVKPVAWQLVVMDTGSTDRTVEIAREHGAEVHKFEWCDDFAAARNAALVHARGDWVLVLDADEELPADSLATLRKELADPHVLAYRLPIVDAGREGEGAHYVPRLFRNAPGVCFRGRIHEHAFESLEPLWKQWGLECRLGETRLVHHGYVAGAAMTSAKAERNLRLLRLALDERPQDMNLRMNLGLELTRTGRAAEGLSEYWEALRLAGSRPGSVSSEFRETLLTQLCTRLIGSDGAAQLLDVLATPLARSQPLTASLHYLKGLACVALQRWTEGVTAFRECLQQKKRRTLTSPFTDILGPAPCLGLARCYQGTGDVAAAERVLRQALDEHAESPLVFSNLARLLAGHDRAVEALQLLHGTLDRLASSPVIWLTGGEIALSQPDFLEFAVDWTGEAVKHCPADLDVVAQRAEALLLQGDDAGALEWWRKSSGRPEHRAALILCELSLDRLGEHALNGSTETVGREFLRWYQRLAQFRCQAPLLRINARLPQLRAILPVAAQALEVAMAEAAEKG